MLDSASALGARQKFEPDPRNKTVMWCAMCQVVDYAPSFYEPSLVSPGSVLGMWTASGPIWGFSMLAAGSRGQTNIRTY